MMKTIILTAALLLLIAPAWAQDLGLLADQPYYDGGWAVGAVYDPANEIDYQSTDDFLDLTAPISRVVVYGFSAVFDGSSWYPSPPAATEPFIVRFYDRETELAPGLFAPSSGTYSVELYDDYGDGWNGGQLDVLVNGTVVLSQITLIDGAGPASFTFEVAAADEITTTYNEGDYAYENYYRVLDDSGLMIAEDGGTMDDMGSSTPTGILPAGVEIVLEPDWGAPAATFAVAAEIEYVGIAWDHWPLYRYTIDLPDDVDLSSGWVSPQIDSSTGSGVGFFWLNSLVGNGLSWLWSDDSARGAPATLTRVRSRSAKNVVSPRVGVRGGESNSFDLSLELWGGAYLPPLCAREPFPEDGATEVSVYAEELTWIGNAAATGYRIYLGTDNPPSNVEDGTDLDDALSYVPTELLPESTYYWQIVPYNGVGDATACPVWSFTTAQDGYVYVGDPGTTTAFSSLPIAITWNYSLVETLYPSDELFVTSGYLTRISYFYDFVETVVGIDVSIWVGETDASSLPGTWVPASELTPVFDGPLLIDHQQNALHIDLTTPYEYHGGNLVVLVQRHLNPMVWDWSNEFRVTESDDYLESSVIYVSDTTALDPLDPQTPGDVADLIPNTAFVFAIDVVSIEHDDDAQTQLPAYQTALNGAYPNPFNPKTTVSFSLSAAQHAKLSVYDMAGKRVAVLAEGLFAAGEHPITWSGTDGWGRGVASGTYLLRLDTADRVHVSKMMLVR